MEATILKLATKTVPTRMPSPNPAGSPIRPKYGNKKTVVDGVTWDSQREYKRWLVLWEMQRIGLIRRLARQVTFKLIVNGLLVCRYRADFVYWGRNGIVVEDSKGFRTEAYKLKKRLMMACHGIEIKEV
jgi:hypothetical protein